MMKFFVKGQRIEITEREVIASGQIAFVTLKFTFDCSWKNLHKVVQFSQCDAVYNRVLGVDGLSCLLPSELHPGMVQMSIFGYDISRCPMSESECGQSLIHSSDSDTTIRATTVPITLHVRPSGFDGESCNVPPTPDLYAQLLAEMKKLLSEVQNGSNGTNGKDGENGLSAYELAIQNGFTGTLTEWLNSLKGADGKDGVDGKDGADGLNGKDGIDGKDGADGKNGTDGKDGLSAYEIALKNGFVGTESEWLASLKGKDGTSPEVSGFATTEYVDERLSEILVILENLPTAITVTLFSYGEDVPEKYGSTIFTIYQNGIQDLSSYIRNHMPFCSAESGYALSYNQTDFGWDGQVYTASTTPITVKSGTAIAVTAQSGVTEKGVMFLIPIAGKSDSDTVQNYIYTSLTTGNCVELPFYWLYCDTFITGLTACDSADDGEYYLCWVGRSNNTHPIVREVKVMN
ncbi:MAG: collagen-like protein [Ruminococcus sp.]|nr:collagen-like protein [Ruminococcus sp.]